MADSGCGSIFPKSGPTPFPCVFIAPAGSRLFHGKSLEEGDRPEHLPYVAQGFAVVAYEIDGPLGVGQAADAQLIHAAVRFRDAEAGVANARAAIDYALARLPEVDPKRLYAVGHSSAATVALQVAASDQRIAAVVAYAPVINVPRHFSMEFLAWTDSVLPGYADFIKRASPHSVAMGLKCPLFLFFSDDDHGVDIQSVRPFLAEVRKRNPRVLQMRAPTGGHYHSMVSEGIPAGIRWLKDLDRVSGR